MSMRVHKAVEPDNLTKKGKAALASLLAAGDGILLLKYDGVYSQFKFDATDGWQAWSRTGERQLSAETVPRLRHLDAVGDRGRVYIGELFIHGATHPEISGPARRQSPQPELEFVVHDSYNVERVEKYGRDTDPFAYRLHRAELLTRNGPHFSHARRVVSLSDTPTIERLVAYAKDVVKYHNGQLALDGLILRDRDAPFVDGAGKDGGIYKLKPRKSLDLLIVDEHVEQRETKLGGYVTVEYRGVRTDVGSGLTQGMLEDMAEDRRVDYHKGTFKGSIAEIEFLSFTKDGKLREPVFKSIRHDKTQPDE